MPPRPPSRYGKGKTTPVVPRALAAHLQQRAASGGSTPSYAQSTFTNNDWDLTADLVDDATLTLTVRDSSGAPIPSQAVAIARLRTFVSAAQSTVETSVSVIAATTGEAIISAYLKNADGTPLPGIPAASLVLASTGTGNTITAVDTVSDRNGRFQWTFSSTMSEAKTLSLTALGLAITDTAAVTVTGGAVSFLAAVPSGMSLYAAWDDPANLSPSAPLSWSGDGSPADNVSSIVTSGYGSAPPNAPANSRVVQRTAQSGGTDSGGDFGNLGIDGFSSNYVAFVHVWKWPGTNGSDGYPYSWVFGGNKQAFIENGGDRCYTVVRAQVPFSTYDAGENYRQPELALDGFSPVSGIGRPDGETDADYLIDLDTWITLTAVIDLRPAQGSRIARLYMQKGTGSHVLIAERTDLTSPVNVFTSGKVNNTNNGRTGGFYPHTGSMYDAYFGVFTG